MQIKGLVVLYKRTAIFLLQTYFSIHVWPSRTSLNSIDGSKTQTQLLLAVRRHCQQPDCPHSPLNSSEYLFKTDHETHHQRREEIEGLEIHFVCLDFFSRVQLENSRVVGSYLCLRLSIKTSIAEEVLSKYSGALSLKSKFFSTGSFEKLKLDCRGLFVYFFGR